MSSFEEWACLRELVEKWAKERDKTVNPDYSLEYPKTITRLEVIDRLGRILVKRDIHINNISIQDDARTLKIFLDNREE